jgi:NAD(P)-dependent dehydrogenase (short-subunit alcohol dehydrogenase family)
MKEASIVDNHSVSRQADQRIEQRKLTMSATRKMFGDMFLPLLFDVTDEEAVQAGAAKVSEHLGRSMLDGLVNNTGIRLQVPGPSSDRSVSAPPRGRFSSVLFLWRSHFYRSSAPT